MTKPLVEINGFILVQVPKDAKDFVIDMGYLIFKIMDMNPKKWVTDAEIERDALRFLKTGKSKFDKLPEDYSMWITSGIPLSEDNYQIIGLAKELSVDQKTEILQEITEYAYYPAFEPYAINEDFEKLLTHHEFKLNNCLVLKKVS